ncbi:MAG: BatA and WFA domain-containing protein [Bacteroidota bacterium]|nr:BatA and WFA domain-containing protein [Bacteroidota bacterium]MDP3145725.1 BatA and WFA domain-containing protein [Bacteroidota bacterium]
MMFVYPAFLWALAAVTIPIIIHLFNFRRYKKVYFTNVKFLKELQHQSKSKSRLREILVLIARCLAIACLVLAFCQPILSDKNTVVTNSGAKAISIYIDNSFSMENVNKQGPLLEIAKAKAKEIVKAFGNGDKFQIITNDFEGKHQRFNSKEDAINVIDEVKSSSAIRLLSDVLKRQYEFLSSASLTTKKIYALSDAQQTTFNLSEIKNDTAIKVTLVTLKANEINNAYIDSCWFETPLQQKGFIQKLHATVVNFGNTNIEIGSAKLFLNQQQIAIASFSVEANSKKEIQFTFECKQEGVNYGSIKIEDFPITFDDEFYFAFNSKINVAVCLINGKDQPLDNSFTSLYKTDSLFKLSSYSELAIDYSSFKTADVLILNQLQELSSGLMAEVLKFSDRGGSIVIIPSQNSNLVAYNQAFSMLQLPNLISLDSSTLKIDKIELASKFYAGVFEKVTDRINLPMVTKHFKLLKTTNVDFESILLLQNADIFFGVSKRNLSNVYLFSTPLNEKCTNFTKHALFVPTFYQICFSSLKSVPLSYYVSSNVVISIKNNATLADVPPHIKQVNGLLDVIPESRVINNALSLYTQHQINLPGFYKVIRNDSLLLPLAFNYSRMESNLVCYDNSQLKTIIEDKNFKNIDLIEDLSGDITSQILLGAEGKKLWKLFIILTLLFIGIEIALLRFLK